MTDLKDFALVHDALHPDALAYIRRCWFPTPEDPPAEADDGDKPYLLIQAGIERHWAALSKPFPDALSSFAEALDGAELHPAEFAMREPGKTPSYHRHRTAMTVVWYCGDFTRGELSLADDYMGTGERLVPVRENDMVAFHGACPHAVRSVATGVRCALLFDIRLRGTA